MQNRLKSGWKIAQRHPWIITMLFIYQLGWGFVLYKVLQSLALPLLYRFPSEHSEAAVQVFMAEAQFQLLKTNIAYVPLAIIISIILARMIVTPLLNAGIYYSIDRDETKQIRPFMTGIKKLGVPFIGIYCCQIACVGLPLLWIIPHVTGRFASYASIEAMLMSFLPLGVGYWAYIYFIRLCVMYIQFGVASGAPILRTQHYFWRHVVPIVLLSCTLLFISALLALLNLSLTMVWASLFSIMLHQLYYLSKSFVSIWEIGAQYQLWSEQ